MESLVNYGYGVSLSNHSSPDYFTGCVVEGTLNIHECSKPEVFKVPQSDSSLYSGLFRLNDRPYRHADPCVAVLLAGSYRGCICPRVSPPFSVRRT